MTRPSFNDDWDGQGGSRRYEGSQGDRHRRPSFTAPVSTRTLAEIARGAPEVVVAVQARLHDRSALRRHFSYITRGGEIALETSYGEALKSSLEVAEFADAWAFDREIRGAARPGALALTLVLSMPKGTDTKALQAAAQDFAGERFDKEHPYGMALHEDRDHPHVHLTVHGLAGSGAWLNPDREELRAWRGLFAARLRQHGVDAEATLRSDRGVIWKRDNAAMRRVKESYQEGRGPTPEVLSLRYRDAMLELMESFDVSPFEKLALERQAKVRTAYRDEIERLNRSMEAGAHENAEALKRILAQMPLLETQRVTLARTLQERMREDLARGVLAPSLAHFVGTRSRTGPDREPSR